MIEEHRAAGKAGREVNPVGASATPSLPVSVLTGLGALITVLGLFAAGDLAVVIVGLSAVAVGGVLHVLDRRL